MLDLIIFLSVIVYSVYKIVANGYGKQLGTILKVTIIVPTCLMVIAVVLGALSIALLLVYVGVVHPMLELLMFAKLTTNNILSIILSAEPWMVWGFVCCFLYFKDQLGRIPQHGRRSGRRQHWRNNRNQYLHYY